jgi:UDP-N-acetylglucosamine 2-epimerase (non-hydrolysing)
MKLAPIMRAFEQAPEFDPILVHTGQHYDEAMSGQFFRELGLPQPAFNLEVGSASHAQQTAEVMKRFEPVVLQVQPDGVLVVGDVNSTVACALVAKKLQLPVVHLEAGLRSFDRSMPEEINRVVTDAISDILLASEESGRRNLLAEGIPGQRIHLVGNVMIDSLRLNLERAQSSDILNRLHINGEPYGIVTLHRPANVDDQEQFGEILSALAIISETVPLYFPVHPRTRTRLAGTGVEVGGRIHLADPLAYTEFLCLMAKASVVLTDSGGIQEETTALGIPCLTLRDNTERPVTVDEGTNTLAGTRKETILAAWDEVKRAPKTGRIPKYWDGEAARRCVIVLRNYYSVTV